MPSVGDGPCYSKDDRVRVECTWRERLRKEADNSVSRSGAKPAFQLNLANQCSSGGLLAMKHSHNRIELITDKEIKSTPNSRIVSEGLVDQDSFESTAIRGLWNRPTDKYDMCETSAHSIGWLLAKPGRAASCGGTPRFHSQARRSEAAETGIRVVEASPGPHSARESWRPRSTLDEASWHDGASASSRLSSQPLPRGKLTGPAAWDGPDDEELMHGVAASGAASIAPVPGGPAVGPRRVPRSVTREEPPGVAALNRAKWRRGNKLCDVTRYSEAYWGLLHHNPFCQRDAGR